MTHNKWFNKLAAAIVLGAMTVLPTACGDDAASVITGALTCTDGMMSENQPSEGITTLSGCLDGDEDGTDDGVLTLGEAVDVAGVAPRYLLAGVVFVGDDVTQTTLNIEAGAIILGDTGAVPGTLVIRRGSQLNAMGTMGNPILFTSAQTAGSRAASDWGGVVINGRAPINGCTEGTTLCEAEGEGGTGRYGGNNAADDSGSITYVRIEFAGKLFSPENELNGLALQGVGNGTMIDHVHVHLNGDDGIEFFGGTANASHLLITNPDDDGLDWTDGWVGAVQHVVIQKGSATNNGVEADNNGENNTAEPKSLPTISNITVVGCAVSGGAGMLLREGTGAHLHNALITEVDGDSFSGGCIDIDHAATFANSSNANNMDLTIATSVAECTGTIFTEGDEATPDGFDVSTWFGAGAGNISGDALDADLEDPCDATPEFMVENTDDSDDIETGGVQPANTATFTFENVTYIGGMGTTNWASWTEFPAN